MAGVGSVTLGVGMALGERARLSKYRAARATDNGKANARTQE